MDDDSAKTEEVPLVPHQEFADHGDDEDPLPKRWTENIPRIAALSFFALILIAGGVAFGSWLGGNGQSSGITQIPHPSGATGSTGTTDSGSTGGGNSGAGSAATGATNASGATGATGATGDTGSAAAGAGGLSSAGSTGATGAGNSGAGGAEQSRLSGAGASAQA
ncbi:MAG: hypothetical protein WAL61_07350, partial [Acidimicrobiales bacterium]